MVGEAIRRNVMDDAFVDAAMGGDPFLAPLQGFINEHAWGSVWTRAGLDLKTRSLVTVSFLTALGKTHELKGHLRGALNNGATLEELREVLLHAAVYAGVPASAEALRVLVVLKDELANRA